MKFFKISLICIGVATAAFLFFLIGAQRYLSTDTAQQRIQARVNQAINGTITWKSSRFSIWGGKVELYHVLLKAATHETLIELDRMSLSLSWIRLLKGELSVNDLFLENPRVYLATDRFANLNLIKAFSTPSEKESKPSDKNLPLNIVIRRLKVTGGFFQYQTAEGDKERQKEQAVFQNVNLTIEDGNLFKQKGRFACQIESGDISLSGIRTAINQLSLKANLQKDRISDLILNVNMDGLYMKASGTIGNIFTNNPLLDLKVKSEASFSKIKNFIPFRSDFKGAVQADSTIQGFLNNPNVDLMLKYKEGKIAGTGIDRINLNCRLKNRYLSINDSDLYTPAGVISLKGDVDFKEAFADGFVLSHPDPGAISYKFFIRQKDTLFENVPLLKGSKLKGTINSTVKVEGTGIYPKTLRAKAALELFVKKLSVKKALSSVDIHVSAKAGMEEGRVTVQRLAARAGKTQFRSSGNYDLSSFKVAANFNLKTPELSEILSCLRIKEVSGKMNVTGETYGTIKRPFADVRLHGENLGFEKLRIGDADARIRFSEGRFSMAHGKIRNHNSTLDISGTAFILDSMTRHIMKSPAFDLALKGDKLFLEDFVDGMKGNIVLDGHFKGDMAHPVGKFDLKGKNIDLFMQKIHDIRISSNFDGDRINLDTFTLVIAPDQKILIDGWISLNKNYSLQLISEGISLKNITPLHLGGADNGKISFNFEGKGNFEDPQLNGKVVLNDLRFNNQNVKDVELQIEVKDQTAHISGGQNLALNASYHLKTQAFSALARFDNTNLTPYLKISGRNELNGFITGKMEVKGNAEELNQIKGSADISRVQIFKKQTEFIGARDFKVFLKHGEISIPGVRLNLLKKGFIKVKGKGKLNGELDLEADGNIFLEVIMLFTDVLPNATGEARLSLKVNGNLSQPHITGDLDLKNAGMTVPGILQRMHDLNGSIHVTPKAVVLNHIQGMLDNGHFELSGTIDLEQYQPSKVSLKLKADNLPVMIPDTLEARFSTELNLEGTPEKSLISGDIQMLEGRYYKDIRLNVLERIGQKSRKEALAASKIQWPFLKNMALDMTIRNRAPFIVDNNMALLTVKPDLHIYGSINHPLISGRAEVESGTVYFQKNEFEVTKGVFDFINPYKIEPTIEVQSEVKIRQWTLFLNASGTPDNLKFKITSDPPESEQDLLSLLITGKTTRELIAGEGGSSLSPKQMLADVLADTVQKEIKDATGLDVVDLEYKEGKGAEASAEVKVTVGKELSRRLTVKYGLTVKNGKIVRQLITEYKFLERLLMNTFQDTDGNYGGGLQFRLEFR